MGTNTNIEELKTAFCEALVKTGRKNIDKVISILDELGFFTAPASTRFHLNCEGGLLIHSYNVYKMALKVRDIACEREPALAERLPLESIAIAALLHDTCKAHIYRKCIKKEKDAYGCWSDVEGYEVDNTDLPIGHGEKSVIMLLRMGLELTDDEIMAIRWHMGPWDLAFQSYEQKTSLNSAKDLCPLCTVISTSDGIASGLLERK